MVDFRCVFGTARNILLANGVDFSTNDTFSANPLLEPCRSVSCYQHVGVSVTRDLPFKDADLHHLVTVDGITEGSLVTESLVRGCPVEGMPTTQKTSRACPVLWRCSQWPRAERHLVSSKRKQWTGSGKGRGRY